MSRGLKATEALDERMRLAFGANVFRARLARGWTQQQLADASEVSRPRISEIETAVDINVTVRTAQRLAHALTVSIHDLLSV